MLNVTLYLNFLGVLLTDKVYNIILMFVMKQTPNLIEFEGPMLNVAFYSNFLEVSLRYTKLTIH